MTADVRHEVHLTVPGVLTAMEAAVEARGRGYVYRPPDGHDQCLYVWEGCASCLIGDSLSRCGVPLAELGRREGTPARRLLRDLAADRFVTYEPAVANLLGDAQLVQDGSEGSPGTWGEALDVARVARAVSGVAR